MAQLVKKNKKFQYLSCIWEITCPDGNTIQVNNLTEFCDQHGLSRVVMSKYGKTHSEKLHRGYKVKQLQNKVLTPLQLRIIAVCEQLTDAEVLEYMEWTNRILGKKGIFDKDVRQGCYIAMLKALANHNSSRCSVKTCIARYIEYHLKTEHAMANQPCRKIQFYCTSLEDLYEDPNPENTKYTENINHGRVSYESSPIG